MNSPCVGEKMHSELYMCERGRGSFMCYNKKTINKIKNVSLCV